MITILKGIIDSFATSGKVFSNEQEFQFELALALKNESGIKDVKLEAVSFNLTSFNKSNKNLKKEKEYTDIIVKKDNEEDIAIELKYKTPDKNCIYQVNGVDYCTLRQGAHNINAYNYICDIKRLEMIKKRYFLAGYNITKGYAILLTNDKNYRYNDFSRSNYWKNFSIDDGKVLKGNLDFNGKNQYATKNRTFNSIKLKGSYKMVWDNYKLTGYVDYKDKSHSNSPGFSYLVVEVN